MQSSLAGAGKEAAEEKAAVQLAIHALQMHIVRTGRQEFELGELIHILGSPMRVFDALNDAVANHISVDVQRQENVKIGAFMFFRFTVTLGRARDDV